MASRVLRRLARRMVTLKPSACARICLSHPRNPQLLSHPRNLPILTSSRRHDSSYASALQASSCSRRSLCSLRMAASIFLSRSFSSRCCSARRAYVRVDRRMERTRSRRRHRTHLDGASATPFLYAQESQSRPLPSKLLLPPIRHRVRRRDVALEQTPFPGRKTGQKNNTGIQASSPPPRPQAIWVHFHPAHTPAPPPPVFFTFELAAPPPPPRRPPPWPSLPSHRGLTQPGA